MAFLLIENYMASTQSDRSWLARVKDALLVLRGVMVAGDKIGFSGWHDGFLRLLSALFHDQNPIRSKCRAR
jgi:hypothetical protein